METDKHVYITGICHPPPLDKSQILPEERWDKYDGDTLKQISEKMIGVPVTIDHPVDRNGVPILHEQYVSTKRGEVVNTRILPDGSCYFVAKCPKSNSVKTKMFSNDLSKGRYKEFSLGVQFKIDPETYEESYVPNHIAILEEGKARRPGCKLLEVLDLSKKSFANTKAADNDVLKKEREKILHRRRVRHNLLSIASNMSTQAVQDDAPSSAPATQQQPPVQQQQPHSDEPKTLTDDELYSSVASGTIPYEELAKILVDARKSNMDKSQRLAEYQRKLEETEAKTVAEKEEQMIQQFIDIANVDLDPNEPISEEARQRNAESVKKAWDRLPKHFNLQDKKEVIETVMGLNGVISVASNNGRTMIDENTRRLREYDMSRKTSQLRSATSDRFDLGGSSSMKPNVTGTLQQRSETILHQKTTPTVLKASVPKRPEHDQVWAQLEAATKPGYMVDRSSIPSTNIFREQIDRMAQLDTVRKQLSR
jgi:hypothetical protein